MAGRGNDFQRRKNERGEVGKVSERSEGLHKNPSVTWEFKENLVQLTPRFDRKQTEDWSDPMRFSKEAVPRTRATNLLLRVRVWSNIVT